MKKGRYSQADVMKTPTGENLEVIVEITQRGGSDTQDSHQAGDQPIKAGTNIQIEQPLGSIEVPLCLGTSALMRHFLLKNFC